MANITLGSSSTVITKKVTLPAFSKDDANSLIELGHLLEKDFPWLARTIADESERLTLEKKDPLFKPAPTEVSLLNKKRRAGRSFLVHLFQGEIDEHFLTTMRSTWLPMLVGNRIDTDPQPARDLLEYTKGLLGGALHFEPSENMVPRARIQIAMDNAFDRMNSCI